MMPCYDDIRLFVV